MGGKYYANIKKFFNKKRGATNTNTSFKPTNKMYNEKSETKILFFYKYWFEIMIIFCVSFQNKTSSP